MKKHILLNSLLSALIAQLGHTDTIVIADAGLPIPDGVLRIDLALVRGLPTLKDVLNAVLTEMAVESYTIAEEASSQFEDLCQTSLFRAENKVIGKRVPHEDFKRLSQQAKAIIRTGECSPYYNIILHANVAF